MLERAHNGNCAINAFHLVQVHSLPQLLCIRHITVKQERILIQTDSVKCQLNAQQSNHPPIDPQAMYNWNLTAADSGCITLDGIQKINAQTHSYTLFKTHLLICKWINFELQVHGLSITAMNVLCNKRILHEYSIAMHVMHVVYMGLIII